MVWSCGRAVRAEEGTGRRRHEWTALRDEEIIKSRKSSGFSAAIHINSANAPYSMAINGTQVTQEELDEMLIEALLTGTVLKWGGVAVEEAETD